MAIDDLVESVSALNRRHPFLHGYGGPFIVLYSLWSFIWRAYFFEHFELGCIGMGVIAVLQVIVVLFCHWVVQINAWMSCSKVRKIRIR